MKKLVLVKYLGFNPEDELCTICKLYPYLIETQRSWRLLNDSTKQVE